MNLGKAESRGLLASIFTTIVFSLAVLPAQAVPPVLFSAPVTNSVQYSGIMATADVNGDGRTDIVMVGRVSSGFSISTFLNASNGTFGVETDTFVTTTNPSSYPSSATSLAVADLNHDNIPDLVVGVYFQHPITQAGTDSRMITVLLGGGDGSFSWVTNYGYESGVFQRYESIVIGDLNGDSNPDIVAADDSGDIKIFLGNGDGSFVGLTNYQVGSSTAVALGDFNGDNKLDVIAADLSAGKVYVLLGNGDGTFQITTNYSLTDSPHSLIVADVNNDGKWDVITLNYTVGMSGISSNSISVLLGNGDGTFQSLPDYELNTTPFHAAAGDFNGV